MTSILALVVAGFAIGAHAEDADACACMPQWTSDYGAACQIVQDGCPDPSCDGGGAWCLVTNPGCATSQDGGYWTYCDATTPVVRGGCETTDATAMRAPKDFIIMMDGSVSLTQAGWDAQIDSAQRFIQDGSMLPEDRCALIVYSFEVQLVSDFVFTDDAGRQTLQERLDDAYYPMYSSDLAAAYTAADVVVANGGREGVATVYVAYMDGNPDNRDATMAMVDAIPWSGAYHYLVLIGSQVPFDMVETMIAMTREAGGEAEAMAVQEFYELPFVQYRLFQDMPDMCSPRSDTTKAPSPAPAADTTKAPSPAPAADTTKAPSPAPGGEECVPCSRRKLLFGHFPANCCA